MARPILEGYFGFLTIFLESSLNFGSENMYDMTIVIILKKDVFVQSATFLLVETWMLSYVILNVVVWHLSKEGWMRQL